MTSDLYRILTEKPISLETYLSLTPPDKQPTEEELNEFLQDMYFTKIEQYIWNLIKKV
jgi:hypothetical protein